MIFKENVYFLYDAEKCVLLSPAKEFYTAQNEFSKKRKRAPKKIFLFKDFSKFQVFELTVFFNFSFRDNN